MGEALGFKAEGGDDGFEAGANLVEFGGRDVFDAGDLAGAEVILGEVEAVAGAMLERRLYNFSYPVSVGKRVRCHLDHSRIMGGFGMERLDARCEA
jgi:hypothetical protein